MKYFCAAMVAMMLPAAAAADTPNPLTPAALTSAEVYTIPEEAELHLYRGMGPGLALWVRRTDGIDVYLSSVGTMPFKGYYVDGIGEVASRYFAQPAGDMSIASVGDSVEGKYIYWSPDLGEGIRDYSDNLIWSADGSAAAMASFEDDKEYAYRNDERFGPYEKVILHFMTGENDLLYLAWNAEDELKVYRNGEALTGHLADAERVVVKEGAHGSGYLYGVVRTAGFWLLHNGTVIEGTGTVRQFAISPSGTSYGYLRDEGDQIEAVINGTPSGHQFTGTSTIQFSRSGESYAMAGVRPGDGAAESSFFEVNGNLIGPFDSGIKQRFKFAGRSETFVYGYGDAGRDYLYVGDTKLGDFDSGSAFTAESSPDGSEYVYFSKSGNTPVLQTRARSIALDHAGFADIVGDLFVDDGGDVHFNVEVADGYVRMLNNESFGNYSNIIAGDMAENGRDVLFVGVRDGAQILYRNNAPVLTADKFLFARFAEIAGREVLIARIERDGKEYLAVDDAIAGPFDEVLLRRSAFDGKAPDALSFHSRTGQVISRHHWPR